MKELADKVAVVTGAGGGIGSALAVALANEGMIVAITDVDADGLAATRHQIEQAGQHCRSILADVSDAASVEELAAEVHEQWGSADLICSNAGVMRPGAVWEQPDIAWRSIIDVNVLGSVNMARSFIPRMLESGREGHFVTTPGLIGLFTVPFSPPGSYTVSKHALLAFTEVLHHELKLISAQIGVSALCPSGVRTKLSLDSAAVDGDTVRRPDVWPLVESLYQAIESGLDPSQVAALTVRAIIDGKFWIYPHPERLSRAKHRADYAVSGQQPSPPG